MQTTNPVSLLRNEIHLLLVVIPVTSTQHMFLQVFQVNLFNVLSLLRSAILTDNILNMPVRISLSLHKALCKMSSVV
jgi:hypothetical protein